MILIPRPPGLGAITSRDALNYNIDSGERIAARTPGGETVRVRAFVKEVGRDHSVILTDNGPLQFRFCRIRTGSLTRLP